MTEPAEFVRLAFHPPGGRGQPATTGALPGSGGDAGDTDAADRLILGDGAAVATVLPAGSAQLVYLDPPFFTGARRRGSARITPVDARPADVRRADAPIAPAYEDRWSGGLGAYLDWLAGLLEGAHRILAPGGSLFLHLDHHAVHGAKLLTDAIFGPRRLVNELVWHYGSGGRTRRHFPRKHDSILWYARSARPAFYPEQVSVDRRRCPSCGERRESWNHLRRHVDEVGRVYRTIRSAGKTYRYYDDEPVLPPDVWVDLPHLQQKDPERTGWPTQKPERLLERILGAATRPGDLVVDLVAGSGTTLAVARRLGRPCVGVDRSPEAVAMAWERLSGPAAAPDAPPLALAIHGRVAPPTPEPPEGLKWREVEAARPLLPRDDHVAWRGDAAWILERPPRPGHAADRIALLLDR